jgi:Uma2 family endonuclease
VRVSYDEGRLDIMSPLPEHEEYKHIIYSLVRVFSEEMNIELETRGSATWKRRSLRKGTEPDACFYVASAARIIGKRTIDLESDPPPDVAVEIDTTNESFSKFPIYAALGVPEIWRYDSKHLHIYELGTRSYAEIEESRFFPGLTPQMIADFVEVAKQQGQTKAITAFRKLIRAKKTRGRKR